MKLRSTILSLRFKDIQSAAMVENAIQQLRFMFNQQGTDLTPEDALFKFMEMTSKSMHTPIPEDKPRIILD